MPRVEELIGGARFMTMLDLAPLEPFGYAHCSGEGKKRWIWTLYF